LAGINCAACHTGQIEYKGTAVRINGGQAMLDSNAFFRGVYAALVATDSNPSRRAKFFADAITAGYPANRMEADFAAKVTALRAPAASPREASTVEGFGRTDATQGIANWLLGSELKVADNVKAHTAPVSFPNLWDIWRLSWVQYNGFLPGWMPQNRNIGETLGVLARVNFVNPNIGNLNPEPLRWQTSSQIGNIIWIEKTLSKLRAPGWPTDVLGPLIRPKQNMAKHFSQLITNS
jgi:hypothetical protein